MKVLFLTNIPSPYRVAFFNELGKEVELTVLFEKGASDERDASWKEYHFQNFTGIILPSRRASVNTAFCPSVCRYLNRSWDHIICANATTPTGMLAIQTMKLRGLKYWIEGDGAFAKSGKGVKEKIKKHFLSGATGYFSTSKAHDEYYLTYGAKADRIYRYPFTSICESDVLKSAPVEEEKRRIKSSLGMVDNPVVLSVGQMIPRKGVDILIRTAARCKGVDFYLVGGKPTDEYTGLKKTLNAENVFFGDFKKPAELKRYYQAASLFLLPTREDIWGLVINEAMANGLPIVTTNRCVAGLELVKNGENGYIVPVEDVPATVEAIQKVMDADTKKMSERSLEIIRGYTIEAMAEAHVRILSKL